MNSKGLNGPFWPCRPDVCKDTNYMKKAPRGGHLTTDPLSVPGSTRTTLYTGLGWTGAGAGLGEAASCGRGPLTPTSQL